MQRLAAELQGGNARGREENLAPTRRLAQFVQEGGLARAGTAEHQQRPRSRIDVPERADGAVFRRRHKAHGSRPVSRA